MYKNIADSLQKDNRITKSYYVFSLSPSLYFSLCLFFRMLSICTSGLFECSSINSTYSILLCLTRAFDLTHNAYACRREGDEFESINTMPSLDFQK